MTESRAPISLPTYSLGDEGRPTHFNAASSRGTAAQDAKSLTVGDAAFILRSDHKWAYAIVTEKEEGEGTMYRFLVDKEKNRKTFPEAVWGKYIRVIKVDDVELAKLKAEEAAKAPEEVVVPEEEAKPENAKAEPAKEANKEESKPADKTDKRTLILGEFSSEVGSWFSSKFHQFNSKKTKESKPAVVDKETPNPQTEDNATPNLQTEDKDTPNLQTEDKDTPPLPESEGKPAVAATKDKNKSKPLLGSLFSSLSFFDKKSEEPKQEGTKAAAAATKDEDKSKAQTEGSKLAVTKSEEREESPAAAAVTKDKAEEKSSSEKPSKAPSPQTVPSSEETRDAVEEKSTPAPARAPASEAAPAPVETASAPEPEIPKPVPIKLLQTPLQFYKASTMTEDPAAAAFAATSFADEQDCYGYMKNSGVVVVENDPAAAAFAETLEDERLYGPLKRQGVVIVDTNQELKRQGVVVVEAE